MLDKFGELRRTWEEGSSERVPRKRGQAGQGVRAREGAGRRRAGETVGTSCNKGRRLGRMKMWASREEKEWDEGLVIVYCCQALV